MERLGGLVAETIDETIEIVAWASNDLAVACPSDHTHFAVYRIAGEESFARLKAAIDASGWYRYFEQAELAGLASDPPSVLGAMMADAA